MKTQQLLAAAWLISGILHPVQSDTRAQVHEQFQDYDKSKYHQLDLNEAHSRFHQQLQNIPKAGVHHPAIISFGARYHKSFIIQHSKKLKDEFTSSNPWMIEAEINWHLRSQEVWDYCYCFPRTGLAVSYVNFDLPEILGSAVAVYPYIEPAIRPQQRLNFSIRFGLGPAFVTKIYDENRNPDNLFFSSHYSFIALLNFSANFRCTESLSVRMAASYNHISNGGYAEPNLGMNFPSLNMGLDYSLQKPIFPVLQKNPDNELYPDKNRFDLLLGAAAKPASYELHDNIYPVVHFGVKYSRVTGRVFAVTAAAEWLYDRSLIELATARQIVDEDGNIPPPNRASVAAGIEWLFGRFIFSQEIGVYLYAPVKAIHPVYQRYGLSFRFTEHISAGLNVKAHAQDADFMEVMVGFSL